MPHWWDHQWEDYDKEMLSTHRKCKNCGLVQQLCQQQVWMRVTGYEWYPKVKRKCAKAFK